MEADLLVLAVLLTVGLGVAASRWGIRGVLEWVKVRALELDPTEGAGTNPYYRLVAWFALSALCGWISGLLLFGPAGLSAQLRGEPPPPPDEEVVQCHAFLSHPQGDLVCPYGYEIKFDKQGMYCTRHGRP